MAINRRRPNRAYGLDNALQSLAPAPIILDRAPTANDLAEIGTTAIDTSTDGVYVLTSIAANAATWTTSPASGATTLASLLVTPGDLDVDTGDVTFAGTLDVTGLTTLGALTVNGATQLNGDLDITTSALFDITSTANADPSILLRANGGTSEVIRLHADQGTAVNSIELLSDAGGITLSAPGLASADAINLSAASGGVDIDGALQVNIASSQLAATAIVLSAEGGAGAGMQLNANTGGINLSTNGQAAVTSSEAAADAVLIDASLNAAGGVDMNAGTGGVAVDTTAGISLDGATASNFTVTGAGQDLTLASVGGSVAISSTEDTIGAVSITSNGGTSETIAILASQGTAEDSVGITSTAGGVLVQSGLDAANSIVIEADAGTSETIRIHADQGTAIGSIELESDAGGVLVTTAALAATTGLHVAQGAETAAIQVGSGAPSHNAPKGSLYLRTDGSGAGDRAYIATDAAGTWTNITTAA